MLRQNVYRITSPLFIIAAFLLSLSLCACGGSKVDMVETPAGMNIQRGRNYKEVIEDFEDKGFSNIRTETIEDLEIGWTVKNEEVEEIIVGGDSKYEAGVLVPADTEVVIRYHSYNMRRYLEEEEQNKGTQQKDPKEPVQSSGSKSPAGAQGGSTAQTASPSKK